ncbi:MAG TPA: cadherin-like domain-containing protein, partial [Gammaproteobacteria bacterium]|nr:cadherin-like domain-containing protein [Gammaproteobacteria bacterium]
NNQLTITNGQPVILTGTELSATDKETPLVDLGFTITGIQHGYFDTITLPGAPITVFSQQMVFNGAIRFVPDNNFLLPAYNVSVSDGILWDGSEAALVRLNALPVNTFTTIESSNTVRNAIIGGTVSGIMSLGFLALRCYLGKRMNGALRNILVVENATVEQEQEEWKRETLSPVAKEVFNRFKTTGFIGYRNEANTKAYVQGSELLLLEIEKHGVEVHFPKLSITERIRLLTAIVDEIKMQLVKPSGICGFMKPAFTPDKLKTAASAIAKVVAMTVKKEKVADRIRQSVGERPKEASDYPVMVGDNAIELQSLEQKFASEAANQDLISQPSIETRMTAIEGHFARIEELSAKVGALSVKYETRFSKVEPSSKELLGHQSGANQREKPPMRVVS